MEEADRKRREEFKSYEMEKKFEQHERLNHIDDEEKRKEEEKRMKEAVGGSDSDIVAQKHASSIFR